MKYSELIQFEPLTTVIKLSNNSADVLKKNVETYVFSEELINSISANVTKNLDTRGNAGEQRGIAVVGSYGTGKSHLMSIIAAIAEDKKMLQYLSSEKVKADFEAFAGQYKVLRFEIGNNKALFELVCYRIENYLKEIGVDFKFNPDSKDTYKEQIAQMMAVFEEAYPDKHFLIVIDELLEYLRSRDPMYANGDLMTLRLLGEACDGTRFKLIYGVQELLYRDPMLQYAADTLNRVRARYDDVLITKEDVEFVVKNRLLRKNSQQKQRIREHLNAFSHLFDGLNTNLEDYVSLFPVHPRYIAQFEQIKHGKNKREILKTLSQKFEDLTDKEVLTNNPGLITYDSYFEDIKKDATLLSIPDIATIKDKVEIIYEKIDNHFTGARKGKKQIAKRITNALAIKALCDDLDKHSGANAEILKEDLCFTMEGVDESDLLKDTIEATANQLQRATVGQYVVKEEQTGDYYIRSEGGVNVDQIIRNYAESVIKRETSQADQYYFNLLKLLLGIEQNPYRTGFNIWSHHIEWKAAKSFRLGYIFFGNPNERSTTEPIQEFYMYFCPIFSKMERSDLPDEVYFDLTDFSDQFKDEICLYAASMAKHNDASSDQKKLFVAQIEEHQKKVRDIFNREFADKTKVIYKGESLPLKQYQMPQEGGSKLALFSAIAATILDEHFCSKFPNYPHFNDLLAYNTPENLETRVKSALKKIVKFNQNDRDGQAILSGLGLLGVQTIDTQNSKYAASIKNKLKEKGPGKVLNRDEILYTHYQLLEQYYSVDYQLDYQLEFVVLAALVFCGDIEITWNGGRTLTASNIACEITKLTAQDFYSFNTIKAPAEANISGLRKLFICLGLSDLTNSLNEQHTYTALGISAKEFCDNVVKTIAKLNCGISCSGVSLLDDYNKEQQIKSLEALQALLDTVQNYDTPGKLKSFKYSEKQLEELFKAYPICKEIEELSRKAEKFSNLIQYLTQAKSYVVESEKPLYDNMEEAINKLAIKLHASQKEQKQYEAELNSLKDAYADYYLTQYTKNRLSYSDTQKRDNLIASDKKKICEIIKDITILTTTDFNNWRNTVTSLKEVDPDLTKEKIKQNPYHDFNPRENYDKVKYSVRDLEDKLDEIYDNWLQAMKATFNDPESKQTISMLDDDQKALAKAFASGKADITVDNAKTIRDIINSISNGFEKVELSSNDFAKIFCKPMNIDEAKAAFEKYLEEQCQGKEADKIRIILSGK